MNLESLANVGEFVGGVGVIASLIYLALQIRRSTSSQRADITARVLDHMAEMQRKFSMNEELSQIFNVALVSPEKLSFNDRARFCWAMGEFLGALEFMYMQQKQGNIDEEIWERWAGTLRGWAAFPGWVRSWEGRITPYSESFSQWVDAEIASAPKRYNETRSNNFLASGFVDLPDQ